MQDLWSLERELWTGGADAWRRLVSDDALMVVPAPEPVMDAAAAIDAVGRAPRWESVAMDDGRAVPMTDATLLVYRARARRDGGDPYRAACSSIWSGTAPRLVFHQQTPLGG